MTHALRFAFAAVMCTFAVWWYLRSRDDAQPRPPTASAVAPRAAPAPSGPPRYRAIDPATRAARLARLDAGLATVAPSGAAPLPGQVDAAAPDASIAAVAPALQACYQQTRAHRSSDQIRVEVDARLAGDAGGTLIVAATLTGDAPFTADLELGPCMQAVLLALELPPMVNGTTASSKVRLTLTDLASP